MQEKGDSMLENKQIYIIVAVIVTMVCSYIVRIRRMQSYDLEKLYKCKDMGEGVLNILGSIYTYCILFVIV